MSQHQLASTVVPDQWTEAFETAAQYDRINDVAVVSQAVAVGIHRIDQPDHVAVSDVHRAL